MILNRECNTAHKVCNKWNT